MVDLLKLCSNSLYGESIRKDIDEEYIIRFEIWLVEKNDERVVDYEALPSGEYVIKYKSDAGIDKIKVEKSMPSHLDLDIFVLSQSKRFMSKFVNEIDGFYSTKVYYQDSDSLNIHMDHYEKLKEADYVENNVGQAGNDYGECCYFLWIIFSTQIETLLCYIKLWNTWRKINFQRISWYKKNF